MTFLGEKKSVRWPGIEPGSNAWKASMLTITPPTLWEMMKKEKIYSRIELKNGFNNCILENS